MEAKPVKTMRPFASWFASIYFIVVALYSFAFVLLYDPYCLPLYAQAGLAVASAIGVFMLKRWSIWISAVSIPLILVIELSALNFSVSVAGFNPNWNLLILHVSYLVVAFLAVLTCLLLIDKRREFK